MFVSQESQAQTEERLRRVISQASLEWRQGAFAFAEFPVDCFPVDEVKDALAFVRDGEVWSALKPAGDNPIEPFAVFSFHFTEGLDNSGFVGWLASHFKKALGTGVFVVCGQNSSRGGIFDYWGVPFELQTDAQRLIDELKGSGR